MTQQSSSHVLPNTSERTVVDPVLRTNTHNKLSAGTSHTIRKIIKKSSVDYFCNECNTHYSQLNWLLEDHPGINTKNFNIRDLRKEVNYSNVF